MTSSPHGLYVQGYTRATMDGTKGSNTVKWSQSQKAVLSSDWSLQLDSMKVESLVIADQHAAVNTFPGLVRTARHITKSVALEVAGLTFGREAPKVWPMVGVKS